MGEYTEYTTEWKLEHVVPYLLKYHFGNKPTTNTELSEAFWKLMGKDLCIEGRQLWSSVPYEIHQLQKAGILKHVLVKKDQIVSIQANILGMAGEQRIQSFIAKYSKERIDQELQTYLGHEEGLRAGSSASSTREKYRHNAPCDDLQAAASPDRAEVDSPTKDLSDLTPYELGESGCVEAIPFLIDYLESGGPNEKRLAASAIRKLSRGWKQECQAAVPALLSCLNVSAPQARQYALSALAKLELPLEALEQITHVARYDEKAYNRDAAASLAAQLEQRKQRKPTPAPLKKMTPRAALQNLLARINTKLSGSVSKRLAPARSEAQAARNEPSPEREKAERELRRLFNLDRFYDEQWESIQQILQGKRLLLIQKTGFGKSLCYQFPATQFSGVTVVFSPLIALMRDQVNALKSRGIAAECIHSGQTPAAGAAILEQARQGKLTLLYIAPERQENSEWLEAVKQMPLAMVVIDEAHCISVWGHDFRPAYRRLVQLVKLLPQDFPVLATTATATEKVADDIRRQMGGEVAVIRGNLLRPNFRLRVVHVEGEDAKMAWLVDFLQQQEGHGLVYVGTRVEADLYADWLRFVGIGAASYHAGLTAERRNEVEKGLLENRWKCIVATNALGMGIDKADIRFLIHTQIPQSPIHYYQEIGRAGRDGKPTEIVLLYHPDDKSLPEYFIQNSRPSVKQYQRVIDALKREPLGERELLRKTNLKRTQIRVIREDLIEQGIIRQVMYGSSKQYEYRFGAPELSTQRFEQLRRFKTAELEQMIEYTRLSSCRMRFLCRYLGDAVEENCGNCDNDRGERETFSCPPFWQDRLLGFRGEHFPILHVETTRTNLINGVAASYYGSSDVGNTIHRCKYEKGGDFPQHLVDRTVEAYRHHYGGMRFDLLVYVPPTKSGTLVRHLSERLAITLQIRCSHHLKKQGHTEPQKIFQNRSAKHENVKNVFVYEPEDEVAGKNILVVDDIFDSGATMKEIGRMLTKLGARKIAPLVIAKTVSGDIMQ